MPATWASQEDSLIGGSVTQRHWTADFCVSNAETSPEHRDEDLALLSPAPPRPHTRACTRTRCARAHAR